MAVTQSHHDILNENSSDHPVFLMRLMTSSFKFIYGNLFIISLIIILILGFLNRDSNYLTAETGSGYTLGIVGGSLMLILLLYPVSKRVALLTRWIPIKYWFGIHMLFGIIGPTMILFHSNFNLGSINSSIALFSMILVSSSGLVGRYIYTHIHHGLYGTRITLKELKLDTDSNHSHLLSLISLDNELNIQLKKMEEKALKPYKTLLNELLTVIYLGLNAKHIRLKIIQIISNHNEELQSEKKTIIKSVNSYTLALRQMAAFKLYEKLFSLWHIMHLPLFFMMIITAVIHIFAVHMY